MRIRTSVTVALIVGWFGASAGALAGSPADRCVGFDQTKQAFEFFPTISPNCLQINRDGQLALAGQPRGCLAVDPSTKSMMIVEGTAVGAANCVSLDLTGELASRIGVIRGPGTTCFGRDVSAGLIRILPRGSPECVPIVDSPKACPRGTTLSPIGAAGPFPGTRGTTLSPVGVPNCLIVDPTTRTVLAPRSGGFFERPEPDWRFRFTGSYGEYRTPKVNTGTFIVNGPGSEVDAIVARQDAEGMEIDVSLVSREFGEFSLEYFAGDTTETVTEPMGGAQIGVVYHTPSPSDSLGINLGRSGAIVGLDTDHKFFNLNYRSPFVIHRYETEDCKYTLRPELAFGWSETEYHSWTQSIGVPGIYTEAWQKVEEWRLGIGLRNAYSHRLNYNIVGRFVLNLDILYRDAELKSVQRNVCSAPGCSPSATFDATVNDSDSGVTWQAAVTFGLDYSFDRNSRFGIEAGYRYIGETAQLQNPTRTINFDRQPHLRHQSASVLKVGVSYRYAF